MKNWLILIVFAFMYGATLSAQSLWDRSKPDQNFSFGFRVGVNFSSTDMDYATSVHTGMHLGGTIDWNIVKSFSLQTGISYVNKGFKGNYGMGTADYLQIPLLLSYRIETPTGVQFHFNIGPYFAYGFSGEMKYAPSDVLFAYNFYQKTFGKRGFFKHFDTGLSAGAYIKLNHILFGVSYEYGMTDIAKVYGKFHNRNVCATLGYNY